MKIMASAALSAALVFGATACSSDSDGVSDDVDQLEDTVQDGAEDLEDSVDDGADELEQQVDEGTEEEGDQTETTGG